MRMNRIFAGALAIAALAASSAWAGGGGGAGGVTHGFQYLELDRGLYSLDLQENTVGGFGYGVNRNGERSGGFGLAFFSDDPSIVLEGGVGGLINGQQFSIGPLTAAAVAWTGIGCLRTDVPGIAGSWVVLFLEADVEIGWAITPWLQLAGYAGMQLMTNLSPGDVFEGMLFYTPTVGVRIAWGSFGKRPLSW
jgi:hypothetical protein